MTKQGKKGFTILEVTLVLVLGVIIMMLALMVWPTLQKQGRDKQRKDNVGRVISALGNYSTNNNGAVPTTATNWSTLLDNYLKTTGSNFSDPTTGDYVTGTTGNFKVLLASDPTVAPPDNGMQVANSRICGSDGSLTTTGAGVRRVAVRVKLESGGIFCQNN